MATVARIRAQLVPRALAPDPGLANLRVAARAAVVQPLVLAFGLLVLHNTQMTLFMVFAVFGLLDYLGNELNLIRWRDFSGRLSATFVSYEGLLKLKKQAGRPKDIQDIAGLKALREGTSDA